MNLQVVFDKEFVQDPSSDIVFREFSDWLKDAHPEHNITVFPWYKGPFYGHLAMEHTILAIRNQDNNKYLVVSYWDRMFDFFIKYWNDFGQLVQIFSSSGLWHWDRDHKENYERANHTPLSYLPSKRSEQNFIEKFRLPFSEKKNKRPFFRGRVYDIREDLMRLDPQTVTDQVVALDDYYKELSESKICLSLDGAGIICHRDIEILGLGSVLFRPESTPDSTFKTHEPLLPDVHYIAFPKSDDPREQLEFIKRKYEEVKDREDFLAQIAHNGLEWYKRNGTIEANIRLLKELVDLNILS